MELESKWNTSLFLQLHPNTTSTSPHTLSLTLSGVGAGHSETLDLGLSLFHHWRLLSLLFAVVLERHSVRVY